MASQSGPEGPWPTGARWRVRLVLVILASHFRARMDLSPQKVPLGVRLKPTRPSEIRSFLHKKVPLRRRTFFVSWAVNHERSVVLISPKPNHAPVPPSVCRRRRRHRRVLHACVVCRVRCSCRARAGVRTISTDFQNPEAVAAVAGRGRWRVFFGCASASSGCGRNGGSTCAAHGTGALVRWCLSRCRGHNPAPL